MLPDCWSNPDDDWSVWEDDDDDDEFKTYLAKMRREHEERKQLISFAAEALDVTGIIMLGEEPHETYLMLHPSTVIPGGWQVSMFDRQGPFSHAEGKDQAKVRRDAVEGFDFRVVRPVTEREFMALSSTPEWIDGVKRMHYIGMQNRMGYDFPWEEVKPYLRDAREASSLDEAIEILEMGMRTLYRQGV